MKTDGISGPGVSVWLYILNGGAEAGPMNGLLQTVRTLMRTFLDRDYGEALKSVDISVYVDGAVMAFDFEGPCGVRYYARKQQAVAKIGIRESTWRQADPEELKRRISRDLSQLFEIVSLRVKRADPRFDAAAFIKDGSELMEALRALPLPSSSPIQEDVAKALRNYLHNRHLAIALGEPVPPLNWRQGYGLVLDPSCPEGVRVTYSDAAAAGEDSET